MTPTRLLGLVAIPLAAVAIGSLGLSSASASKLAVDGGIIQAWTVAVPPPAPAAAPAPSMLTPAPAPSTAASQLRSSPTPSDDAGAAVEPAVRPLSTTRVVPVAPTSERDDTLGGTADPSPTIDTWVTQVPTGLPTAPDLPAATDPPAATVPPAAAS
jgi:hypothetical protein